MIGATATTPGLLPPTAMHAGAPPAALPRGPADFDRVLRGTAAAGTGKAPAATAGEEDEAYEAARDFVAITFLEPILKQVRETSQAAPPFAPTNGQKQFRAMLDANLAREITGAARFPLVDRLARDLRGHRGTDALSTHAVRE